MNPNYGSKEKGNIEIDWIIDGQEHPRILLDVLYVPNLKLNLFPIGLVSKC